MQLHSLQSFPGYLIEQNQTKFQSNLIEHSCSIDFDCVQQSNKLQRGIFCELAYVQFCSETEQKS